MNANRKLIGSTWHDGEFEWEVVCLIKPNLYRVRSIDLARVGEMSSQAIRAAIANTVKPYAIELQPSDQFKQLKRENAMLKSICADASKWIAECVDLSICEDSMGIVEELAKIERELISRPLSDEYANVEYERAEKHRCKLCGGIVMYDGTPPSVD